MSVIFQIIAFDELRTDFKNPIDQSNPTRAVSSLLFQFFQEWSNPYAHTERNPFTEGVKTNWGFHSKNAYDLKCMKQIRVILSTQFSQETHIRLPVVLR